MADVKEIIAQLGEGKHGAEPKPATKVDQTSQEASAAAPTTKGPKLVGRRAIIEFVEDGSRGVVAQVKFTGVWRGADLVVASRALNREFRRYLVDSRKGS